MSEGGSLFNPGYLGSEFKWWIGQVADDATWRDNVNPAKVAEKNNVRGWGRRYKVRILGMHDWGGKEAEGIPDGQLPWANVMYPITAGGGQSNAYQTPAIRQGNIVFGFWMDGSDQEIPVIMGILGNNPQTPLKYTTGAKDPDVTNNKGGIIATSGFAEGVNSPEDNGSGLRPSPPDKDLITDKPKLPEDALESSSPPTGAGLNQFGLRADQNLNAKQFADAESARQRIETDQDAIDEATQVPIKDLEPLFGARYKQQAVDKYVGEAIAAGVKTRKDLANSPLAKAVPGATIEAGGTAPHLITAGDIKIEEKREEKIVLFKSDKQTDSATKSIQLAMENLMVKVQKHLSARSNYADSVSLPGYDMEKEVEHTADEIAKYQKVIFNKMMEYSLKKYNKEQAASVSGLPATQRWQYSEVKEKFTEITLREYNIITNELPGQMRGELSAKLDIRGAEAAIDAQHLGKTSYIHPVTGKKKELVDKDGNTIKSIDKLTSPSVDVCYAEDLVGHSIMSFQTQINDLNNKMIQNSNMYLRDVGKNVSSGNLGGPTKIFNNVTGNFDSIPTPGPIRLNSENAQTGGIQGNIVSAMNFLNTKSDIFPFEPPRNEAVSDYYQLSRGGGATSEDSKPNMKGIAEQVNKHSNPKNPSDRKPMRTSAAVPFLEPSKNQPDISWLKGRGKVTLADLQNIPSSEINQKSIKDAIRKIGNDNLGNQKK